MEDLIRSQSQDVSRFEAETQQQHVQAMYQDEEGHTGQFDDALTGHWMAPAMASGKGDTDEGHMDAKGRPMIKVGQDYVSQTTKIKVDGAMKEVRSRHPCLRVYD
jgi:hypothetical protein